MKHNWIVVIFVFAVLFCGCGSSNDLESMESTVKEIQASFDSEFAEVDDSLSEASRDLSGLSLGESAARTIVGDMCRGRDYAIDCAAIDDQGIMRIVEPEAYRAIEGSDISTQESFQQAVRTGDPGLSPMFETVELVQAAAFQYPVFDSAANVASVLSLLFEPRQMCEGVIQPLLADTDYSTWVMQNDGLILYESDPSQIGLNLFNDPLYQDYPELIALGRRIAAEAEGRGEYSFVTPGTTQVVRKEAVWRDRWPVRVSMEGSVVPRRWLK